MTNFKDYKLLHSQGFISIENIPDTTAIRGDLGIQIENGKVWLCIDGIAFLRFTPRIPSTCEKNHLKIRLSGTNRKGNHVTVLIPFTNKNLTVSEDAKQNGSFIKWLDGKHAIFDKTKNKVYRHGNKGKLVTLLTDITDIKLF